MPVLNLQRAKFTRKVLVLLTPNEHQNLRLGAAANGGISHGEYLSNLVRMDLEAKGLRGLPPEDGPPVR